MSLLLIVSLYRITHPFITLKGDTIKIIINITSLHIILVTQNNNIKKNHNLETRCLATITRKPNG